MRTRRAGSLFVYEWGDPGDPDLVSFAPDAVAQAVGSLVAVQPPP